METDNDPVDQNLLLQFTCLGTTDKDDLVKQFRELIDKVNDATASFFLEMNNWLVIFSYPISYSYECLNASILYFRNLQNAICSFLDYETPNNLPSMSLIESHQLTGASPNTRFDCYCIFIICPQNPSNIPLTLSLVVYYYWFNYVNFLIPLKPSSVFQYFSSKADLTLILVALCGGPFAI